MAGWFGNVEVMLEVQGSISEFPVSLGCSRNPGFSGFIIHGGKGFDYYRV